MDFNCSLPVSPYLQMITNVCNHFYQKIFGCYIIRREREELIFVCLRKGRNRMELDLSRELFFFPQEKPLGSRPLFLPFFLNEETQVKNIRHEPQGKHG